MRGNGMGVAAANRFGGENPEPVFGKSSEGGIYAGLPFCGRFRRQFAVLVEKPTTTPHDARHHAGSALDPRRVRPATIPPISCRRLSLIIRQEPAMTCRLTCHRNFEACRSLNGGFTASKLECDLARPGQLLPLAPPAEPPFKRPVHSATCRIAYAGYLAIAAGGVPNCDRLV